MPMKADEFKSLKARYNRARTLDNATWERMWRDLADYILPRHGRWRDRPTPPGSVDRSAMRKIINGTASRATSIAVSGLKGGLTPHSLPWFKLSLWDDDMNRWGPARDWLIQCEKILYGMLSRSNFYGAVQTTFLEQLVFGTGPFAVYEDPKSALRCTPWTVGQYALLTDHTGRVDTGFRWFWMSVRGMRDRFGEENLSQSAKNALINSPDDMRVVVNAIYPRQESTSGAVQNTKLPWASVYWEDTGSGDLPMFESGFHTQPVMFPRWEVIGEDAYGSNCPGMENLGDIMMLQKLEADKLAGIGREANPPMSVPMGFKGRLSLKPNAVNYINPGDQERITRTVDVKPQIGYLSAEIQRVEDRIKQGFFNDLFLSMINDKNGMTAEEVSRRHEQTLMILGPFIERQNSEFLSPFIDRVWDIAVRGGHLPPAPQGIGGQEVKVEYVSMLAQAQKLVGTQPMEKTLGITSGLAQLNPEVLDKLNMDKFVDDYAMLAGVDPKIIRTDDEVAAIRAARQQQMQQQAAMEQAQQAANVAKNLNGIDMEKMRELGGSSQIAP